MKWLQSILLMLLSLVLFSGLQHHQVFAADESKQCFIVTAYYSPLPDQDSYMKGSYEADIRLNGRGTHGASGKEVFTGMIAAPKTYAFGTKIYLEGYGVGEVADRGGAIVSTEESDKHECDRLDLWFGKGDDGLARAKNWGKRKLYGQFVDSDTAVTLQFKKTVFHKYEKLTVTPESGTGEVTQLQNLFKDLEIYRGEVDGQYDSIASTLLAYQKKSGIITADDDWGAGYFGPQTMAALRQEYSDTLVQEESPPFIVVDISLLSLNEKIRLQRLADRIDVYLTKQSGGNEAKFLRYKENLKKRISSYIARTKNEDKKRMLQYLQMQL